MDVRVSEFIMNPLGLFKFWDDLNFSFKKEAMPVKNTLFFAKLVIATVSVCITNES